jgi:hypothetical protein
MRLCDTCESMPLSLGEPHAANLMALEVTTPHARLFLGQLTAELEAGHVEGWTIDRDKDLTISRDRYAHCGWFRPHLIADRLVFGFLNLRYRDFERDIYGYYHGQLASLLCRRAEGSFSGLTLTPHPDRVYDRV